MLDATLPDPAATRLRALLDGSPFGLGDETVDAARSIDPEAATAAVVSLLQDELSHPAASRAAIRAAHLAHELGLAGAVPQLVRCVEVLDEFHPLRRAALAALARLGSPAVDALLDAFDRCAAPDGRTRIAEALSRATVDDDRIRAALVRLLEDDPANGARYLAERGDWRAVPDLAFAADRLTVAPLADCDLCAQQDLSTIAHAARVLGGALSPRTEGTIDHALAIHEASWMPFEGLLSSVAPRRAPADRAARPGRNDPCPCGSGKKYKRCHLAADEREGRH